MPKSVNVGVTPPKPVPVPAAAIDVPVGQVTVNDCGVNWQIVTDAPDAITPCDDDTIVGDTVGVGLTVSVKLATAVLEQPLVAS